MCAIMNAFANTPVRHFYKPYYHNDALPDIGRACSLPNSEHSSIAIERASSSVIQGSVVGHSLKELTLRTPPP